MEMGSHVSGTIMTIGFFFCAKTHKTASHAAETVLKYSTYRHENDTKSEYKVPQK
jgi:hypothetical protein